MADIAKCGSMGVIWCVLGVAGAGMATYGQERAGPDVQYTDCTSTSNYGVVGQIRGYALGSNTCNIGSVNLIWASSGTPGLAMNMYRMNGGRLIQIGQGWVKTACCAAAGSGCGMSCNGQGGGVLGAGCLDVYSSGFNGGQTRLAPRSSINAFTGVFSGFSGASGDVTFRRLQVALSNLPPNAPVGSQFFIEGQYVASDEASDAALNNASYKRVNIDANGNMALVAPMFVGKPAIYAWREHGGGSGVVDPSVTIQPVDVPLEGRFFVGHKATALGGGRWRYDYAVYNLTSDRCGGSFEVAVPPGSTVTNIGFNDVASHSGEPYDNTDWSGAVVGGVVRWSTPQTFAQNPNSNAIRWGTMYNFWFEVNAVPTSGTATLGLFKPHTPSSVPIAGAMVPGPRCAADWDASGELNPMDVAMYVNAWWLEVGGTSPALDIDGDGQVRSADVAVFVNQWTAALNGGC